MNISVAANWAAAVDEQGDGDREVLIWGWAAAGGAQPDTQHTWLHSDNSWLTMEGGDAAGEAEVQDVTVFL